jgi:asparagine N-glycosylation enzyme membrane subunit Stt3
MRFRWIVSSILVVLATLATIAAETNIDRAAAVLSMSPPLVLLVCGLILVAVGAWIRKWVSQATIARAQVSDSRHLAIPETLVLSDP